MATNQSKQNQPELTQDQISAMLDGRLKPGDQTVLHALLATNDAARETFNAWQTQRKTLRGLHGALLHEAIPDALLAAARRAQSSRRDIDQWARWGGMAAAVLLAFGVGWFSHGRMGVSQGQQLTSAPARAAQSFAHQASLAHAVFSPEIRHPVEVPAAQQEHLVQWLSKRVGKPLKVPLLASQGYELVGGRLLPGDGAARAQFMFQNAAGLRLTLYLGAVEAGAAAQGSPASAQTMSASQETAFRFSGDGPVPSFYWIDHGFGYALSGAVSRDQLMQLAQLVYQQL